ncbi:MAG: U32 family peptidase [Prevotella sp.]|uniref:peptidase U32 family protein n=1 Tax=Prevotella sp. TaxID=59823 RepID=UPI002A26C6C3|nr:U32 family peptidase [Prevotella sp.]MDD7318207.1 U32 family peptidase [Prevotellaceae bacterium]MDY4020904.1 U32 family peptidase [Prevotella sp.]
MKRQIELLAPAKDLECGIAAITHGADAVYIGANRFGARAAAGNSIEDIEKLCRFAHTYSAKVYVTVNTILYDDEIEDTRRLLSDFEKIGVDAVLVQDMAVLQSVECMPHSFSLHASTQTDNRSVEKVKWLQSVGFRRVVLARELSAEEIAEIHRAVPDMELEAFVHGALCVSYSGQCYASQHCFGRSANRGACAQFCRLKFQLEDADGNKIDRPRYLLSLKDMCRIDNIEQLIDSGVTSFKIEGRLKDAAYVKNVVSAYSRRLDDIIRKSGGRLARASLGAVEYFFTPNLHKTFNRGFTDYFINGRSADISSPDTPKAIGEYVGKVKEIIGSRIIVAGTSSFANGDGLCYINGDRELEGFRVNRAENNFLIPAKMPSALKAGMSLYRNNDMQFERELSRETASRKIPITLMLSETDEGFSLKAKINGTADAVEIMATATLSAEKQDAKTPQQENIVRQLTKLGDTPFKCMEVYFEPSDFKRFIPSSLLSSLRRDVSALLTEAIVNNMKQERMSMQTEKERPYISPPASDIPYLYNISNRVARDFYKKCGAKNIGEAFELKAKMNNPLVMQCRHCLRYNLGYCVKHGGKRPTWHEPLVLTLPDGRRFPLEFDCKNCQMNVYAE